jgi:hypothetical protein
VGKDGDGHPAGQTYVLKGNEADIPFKSAQPGRVEQDEIIQAEAPNSEVTDDECPFPMPEDPPESSSPHYETMEQASLRAYRQLKFWTAQNEWESRPRPDWWSPAWEAMAELKKPDGTRIPTGSPAEFKECITGDVIATDSFAFQSKTSGIPGQDVHPSVDPDLTNCVAGGVWNESGSTMVRRCGRDVDINELSLATFKDVLSVTPDACELTYVTCSDWLLGQWLDMLAWKEANYEGLDRKACPYYWQDIMGHAETRLSKVTMMSLSDNPVWGEFRDAVAKYGLEGIE